MICLLFWTWHPKEVTSAKKARQFKEYETEVHPYSGLHPETWALFLENLRFCEILLHEDPAASAAYLYAAIDNIHDLASYVRRADDADHQEALAAIAQRLGVDVETAIRSTWDSFVPKYLNETVPDETDEVRDFRRMRARDFRLYPDALGASDAGAGAV